MRASDLLEALTAAGAPMEAVLIALRALEEKDAQLAERDAITAAKRAKDAERKRAERASVVSTDSPRTDLGQSAPPPTLSRPPNEINLTPPPIPTQIKKPAHARVPEGSAAVWRIKLPGCWKPACP